MRVLLVEDNLDNRRLIARMLERLGCVVTTAQDGADGAAKAKAGVYDLVFMDIEMPEIDGLEAARRIRATEADEGGSPVRIVALTAHALKGYRERCLAAGMDDYLEKPVKRKHLLATLEKWGRVSATILVADDSADNRLLARTILEKDGIASVVEACDGAEALQLARQHNVDLLLLDMEMPVLDGFDTCAQLRAAGFEPPIIAMTGHTREEEIQRCWDAGCDRVLRKPYTRDRLVRAVSELLATPPGPRNQASQTDAQHDAIQVLVDADLADLIPGFLDNRTSDVRRLTHCINTADFESARRIGHDLKGVGEPYGFAFISVSGKQIEDAARSESLSGLRQAVEHLETYLSCVHVVVRSEP